jgi:septum site-determining protein MinC
LQQQVGRSPRFFLNAPVVLDLKDSEGFTTEEAFLDAGEALRRHTLALVGVQNALPEQISAAAGAGLAVFAPNSTQPSRRAAQAVTGQATAASAAIMPAGTMQSARPPARLITEPVRSGTQIYARGTDLVVTAAVSAGAELVADGHIHVYAALRGRALAGASGDVEARIFCSRLEAELVSIAGRYLVSEQLPPEQRGSAVHIALVDDQLTVTKN